MLFKVFLLSIVMMNCYPTACPVELEVGQVINDAGDGHQVFDMQYGVWEPYTYINYGKVEGANEGDFVLTTFEMGDSGEPDDILFRHDLVIR